MSILIKDMEMPVSCLNCPLETDYGTCGHFNNKNYAQYPTNYHDRPNWCPLIYIPDKFEGSGQSEPANAWWDGYKAGKIAAKAELQQ